MASASFPAEPLKPRSAPPVPGWRFWTLVIAGAAVAGVLAGRGFFSTDDRAPVATARMEGGCDLRSGPCSANFAGGARIGFRIVPEGIPVSQPLTLTVTADGLAAEAVEVDFQGVDMNMGFNRVNLDQSGEGRFSGEALLPVCIRGGMTWQATVVLDTDEGPYEAAFRFDTRVSR